jgi:hypothetical protein
VKRVVLTALMVMTAAILVVMFSPRGGLSAGPVNAGKGGTANGQPIDAGVPYSFGYLLRNYGTKSAVIEQVRVLGVTGPIEVLGVWARRHPSGPKPYLFLAAFGFPPPDYPSKPLAQENVIPVPAPHTDDKDPAEGLQLVVGVKSTGPGVGRIRGIEFTYRVGHRRFRNYDESDGYLCAPASDYVLGGPKEASCRSGETFDKKFVEFRVPIEQQPGD